MFPDINRQNRLIALTQRVLSIARVHNEQFLALLGQPGPTRSEVADCLSSEVLEEEINCVPLGLDVFAELSFRRGLIWSDAVPEEGVVPMLEGVVEYLLFLAAR